jgi:ubiquinone/menaquinone biosynthesis C-methylase UbiE
LDNVHLERCPNCRGRLLYDGSEAVCVQCDQRYPVHVGIPDLRWPRPPDGGELCALSVALLERYATSSFDEMVAFEIESLSAPERLKKGYLAYRLQAVERGARFERMFREGLDRQFQLPGRNAAIDLGCGSGASLPSLAAGFESVWGVDPYLPDLILGRKLCEECGLENVHLAQARGQNLPFEDGVFDYARALNVIEHLFDVEIVLSEVVRCLGAMGCFCGDSRNRFDPLLPEPHVKLRWVGFWPRRLMPWYVRTFRHAEYGGVHLLSLPELRRHMRMAFGERYAVMPSRPFAYGYGEWLDRLVTRVGRYPWLSRALLWVYPSYFVLAQRM